MNELSFYQLSLELVDPKGRPLNNISDLKLAHAKRGIKREIFVSGETSLYELHVYIQKLFGWKDFYTHIFSLSDEDYVRVTRGNPQTYEHLCGILFRSDYARCFDWYWHDLKEDPLLVKASIIMEGSFFNTKRRMRVVSELKNSSTSFKFRLPNKNHELAAETNCLIERLPLKEIFVPYSGNYYDMHSPDTVDKWKKTVLENADFCLERLKNLRDTNPRDFFREYDALEEFDSWRESFEQLQRIRDNPAAVESRFGLEYQDALMHHLEMFLYCFDQSQNIVENYNPVLNPFFCELNYKYDRGQNWQIKIRCLNKFEIAQNTYVVPENVRLSADLAPNMVAEGETSADLSPNMVLKGKAPDYRMQNDPVSKALDPAQVTSKAIAETSANWVDSKGRTVPKQTRDLLESIKATHSAVCSKTDGVMLMDDTGGVAGFFEFLRTLNGRDRTQSKRVRELARNYGWNEEIDPAKIRL